MAGTTVPWFRETPGVIHGSIGELLEKYSKIPHDEIESHVVRLRNQAWKLFPYPCIGSFGFLDIGIEHSALYAQILTRLKDGQKLIDIGCCFGQTVRKLVYDGVPPENVWSTDIEGKFIDLGYDLFLDKQSLRSNFIAADALNPQSALSQLNGQIDIAHLDSFFHLFDWRNQKLAAKRIIQLLKPEKGCLLVGRQVGRQASDGTSFDLKSSGPIWVHSAMSFEKMWNELSDETGTTWKVHTRTDDKDIEFLRTPWKDNSLFWLLFTVERVD